MIAAPLSFGLSLGASVLGGILGMAGGIFIVPALTACGVDIRIAIGASLVSVVASSVSSAAPLLRRSLTNIRLASLLELATTLGALTGVFVSGLLPTSALFLLFAIILVVSAKQMLTRRADASSAAEPHAREIGSVLKLHSTYVEPSTGVELPYVVQRVPLAMGLMYCAGVISALLGIGSGVLKIPAMDSALRLPLKVSSATSSFMIGVTAAASAAVLLARGQIVTGLAGPVALGSVVGALAGARIFVAVSNEKLRTLFVVVLVFLAVQMGLEALGVHLFGAMR